MAAIFRKIMGVIGFDMINTPDWSETKIIACRQWPQIESVFDDTDGWGMLRNGKTLLYDDGMVTMYCAWFEDGEDVFEGFSGNFTDLNELLKHNEIMESKELA